MNDSPRFDPARSASIRGVLLDAVTQTSTPASPVSRRRRTMLIVSVAAATVIVAGAGTGYALTRPTPSGHNPGTAVVDPTGTPAPVPSETDSPAPQTSDAPGYVEGAGTPSPTPLPVSNDPADPSTWTITFDSVGPFQIRVDTADQVTAGIPFTKESLDPGLPDRPFCDAVAYRSSTYQDITVATSATDEFTVLMVSAGEGQLSKAGPKTAKGIGVGSSLTEFRAAYPGLTPTRDDYPDHGYTQYRITDGQGRYIAFQTDSTNTRIGNITVTPLGYVPLEIC